MEFRGGLYDPDRNVANSVLQWQTAETIDSETWSDINGASDSKYTPVPSDVGKYLRLNVSYDDFLGPDKQASATASNPVYRAANGLPSFDEGGDATRQVPENAPPGTRVGAAVTATDPEGDALTYSLASGSDSGNFTLDPSTGRMVVSSDAILDYEANPTLIVELQVSDGNDANHEPDSSIDDNVEVVVNLVDLDEPGRVSLSSMEPRVDTAVVATLTDLDGSIRGTHWQWEKSVDGLSGWTAIDDNSEDTYTPTADDMDKYLRAMAEYTDGHGAGKSAVGMTDDAVGEAVVVDTSLQSLTLTEISLPFHRDTMLYSHSVPNDVESTTVTATPSAPSDVQVEITPSDSDSGTTGHQVALILGFNEIRVTVRENGGVASTTYAVQVTRLASEPEPDPQPVTDPEPSSTPSERCEEDERNGLIANCVVTRFAAARVEHDGSFNIDWSEWDSRNPDVTGYTLFLQQLRYRSYYDGGSQMADAVLADVYESCAFVDDLWDCEGPLMSNLYIDWAGAPEEVDELATDQDITQWNSSLDSPGILVSDETYYRWSGDAADPDNQPEEVTYTTKTFEMDFHHFLIYVGSQTYGRKIVVVNGANGFDER